MKRIKQAEIVHWPDALFSCVYRWIHGHTIDVETAEQAIWATAKDDVLKVISNEIRELAIDRTTYEWLSESGYLSSKEPDEARKKRESVILKFITAEALKALLTDSARINRVFPSDAMVPEQERDRLGDGTKLNEEEINKLENLNRSYTHVLAFGDHHVVSMRANPVTGETHAFQTLNSFRNNFLDYGRVAERRLGEAWLNWPLHAKRLDGVGFYPNPALCPSGVYNLFTGLAIKPMAGDCSVYLEHLKMVICAGDEEAFNYLIGWLAHLFQKPEEKPSVAVVMKSIEGTGKGSMVKPIMEILGMYGIQVNGSGQIAGRFNGTIANKLFVFIDEAELTDTRSADRLKAIISEPTINLERKGKDPEPMPNYARFIFASNHDRVIQAGMRERRYLVLEPDGSRAQDKQYFDRLHQWIKNDGATFLLNYLLHYDLSRFDPRRPPVTAALIEEKLASLPPVYQFIYSEIWTGKPFNDQGRIFATELVDKFIVWCESTGETVKPASARSAIGKVMSRLNFEVQGRPDRGQGKYYVVPELEYIQENFAALIGEESNKVFTT